MLSLGLLLLKKPIMLNKIIDVPMANHKDTISIKDAKKVILASINSIGLTTSIAAIDRLTKLDNKSLKFVRNTIERTKYSALSQKPNILNVLKSKNNNITDDVNAKTNKIFSEYK